MPAEMEAGGLCRIDPCIHFRGTAVLSADDVKNHLRTCHPDIPLSSSDGAKLHCPWIVEGHTCSKELSCGGLVKHIAVVHLRLTAQTCSYCHTKLSRSDALLRHMRRDCKEITPDALERELALRKYRHTCIL